MGVFSKLKNIFYDEEYIDEPEAEISIEKSPKKEVIVESKPKIEEIKIEKEEEPVKEETYNERELFRSERTFNFTEFDEEELPPRKSVLDLDNNTSRNNSSNNSFNFNSSNSYSRRGTEVEKQTIPEVPKTFKPSPVISPIYGILDKDYTKDEIVTKTPEVEKTVVDSATTYDTVRRKAYGTLEDELEDTLNSMNRLTPNDIRNNVDDIEEDVKELEEKSNKIEELITKIEKTTADISVGDLEEKVKNNIFEEDEEDVDDKTMTDSTLEHDLFNLIDSMYDDKED